MAGQGLQLSRVLCPGGNGAAPDNKQQWWEGGQEISGGCGGRQLL